MPEVSLTDCLAPKEGPDDDDSYILEKIRERFEVVDLCQKGYLAYIMADTWMAFYVLQWESAYEGGPNCVRCIWSGSGPSGNLRELRHSYFEEYIFYIDLEIMKQATIWLQQHFD